MIGDEFNGFSGREDSGGDGLGNGKVAGEKLEGHDLALERRELFYAEGDDGRRRGGIGAGGERGWDGAIHCFVSAKVSKGVRGR